MAKEVFASIDLEALNQQILDQRLEDHLNDNDNVVRTSIFTLGKDKNVSNEQLSAPDLTFIELLRDGLHNPYLQINWQLRRQDIDSGRIVAFDIYKKKLSEDQAITYLGEVTYNRFGFDKLADKSKNVGKFSEEKKAIPLMKRGLVPLPTLNNNLYQEQLNQNSNIYQPKNFESAGYSPPTEFLNKNNFQKIATVDCTKFLSDQKNNFVVEKDRNFVFLYFRDKAVGYQETFDYYVQTVTKELGKSSRSNVVRITVADNTPISPPRWVVAKQTKENEINISVGLYTKDLVYRVLVYKKREDQINYTFLSDIFLSKNSVIFTDNNIQYGHKYSYRVFCQNIHGMVSEPKTVTFFSSVQKVIAPSRSNTLKTPIMSAVQDQNSDFVKVSIFPNDPLISYYQLERKNLTTNEKSFLVPGKDTNSYGGNGWDNNKFFVEKTREEVQNTENSFTSQMSFKEIQFIDQTIQLGHIYQYRVRGYDLFTNGGPYAFSIVKTEGKKSIRAPINVRREVLRGFPFRVKISWDDDNLIESGSQSNKFKIQRRKINENFYETFPISENKFIIDEVATVDAVNIDGIKPLQENISISENTNLNVERITEFRRSFKLPLFLKENQIYYYRIIAISPTGQESNATQEFKVISIADLSEPVKFSIQVQNMRVRPIVSKLFWESYTTKSPPDFWVIERKIDVANDTFKVVGKVYLQSEFLDYNLQAGNTYLYRIRAFDSIGRASRYSQARITV